MQCCVINCTNTPRTAKDTRTGAPVRMHTFPDPVKDRERCLRWINNVRRKTLTISNVKYKRVCSVHFDVTAYNCPTDIASCSLMPSAVPTIKCINPQKLKKSKRKQKAPTKMPYECDGDVPLDTTTASQTVEATHSYTGLNTEEEHAPFNVLEKRKRKQRAPTKRPYVCDGDVPLDTAVASQTVKTTHTYSDTEEGRDPSNLYLSPESSVKREDENTVDTVDPCEPPLKRVLHEPTSLPLPSSEGPALSEARKEIEELRKQKYNLTKKLKRAKQKCVDTEIAARKFVDKHNQRFLDNLLSNLSDVPRNLFKILLSKKLKHIRNWSMEEEAMNMCLSLYSRSSGAYKVLRALGFTLPHPRTLQRKFHKPSKVNHHSPSQQAM